MLSVLRVQAVRGPAVQAFCQASRTSRGSLHTARPAFNTTKEISPLGKLAQGINAIRSTVLTSSLKQALKSPQKPVPFTGEAATWNQAIREAQSLVETETERMIDPAQLVGRDLWELKGNIGKLLGSGHPFLDTVAKHYFSGEGKYVRPLLVLLVAQATSIAPKQPEWVHSQDYQSIDTPISHNLENITSKDTFDRGIHYTPSMTNQGCSILPTQRRLAEISEMIHTASLLHDDVIDASETRRNLPSANASFGNKMAVLGGDFLLARASIALARLRNAECTELMATCIANLVEGEFMQLKNTQDGKTAGEKGKRNTFDYYMEKTYMKTGSLIAQSCKASAVLGGSTHEVSDIVYNFGRHLGLAFQLIDDMLDFTVSAADLGKPAGADLKLGLATAPVLFAWEEFPALEPLIKRKFSEEGDEEQARLYVYQSDGLKKTLGLAEKHCQLAIDSLNQLPPSDARSALIQLTQKLLTRRS
ncbi:Solanesyl pyrophosphate synthase [Phycomyces blakesleeanus]|uniref:Solanesyl pyrophosphate synthase n=2 Tax=Phycomyces blakesleeanus TaxID=4837 RepID=A0A162PL29_PHYB8|nr:Solanesyl pyrophosphate synthase [Phycomyces blakesleeanus NRRL 1555(-)]OAD73847.1 Solanesyl pyrophosphate synthase [Phycomyces blakesleeanus NRRL 1555(-)]|eukprot:XP_018291887.1 Solanesyl pyrophosphate synthase [Phycomyces blakesleeanus NRRL 1555(-)]